MCASDSSPPANAAGRVLRCRPAARAERLSTHITWRQRSSRRCLQQHAQPTLAFDCVRTAGRRVAASCQRHSSAASWSARAGRGGGGALQRGDDLLELVDLLDKVLAVAAREVGVGDVHHLPVDVKVDVRGRGGLAADGRAARPHKGVRLVLEALRARGEAWREGPKGGCGERRCSGGCV